MNVQLFVVAGIFAFALSGGNAAQEYPLYDYGTEYAYGANVTGILNALKTKGFYKFSPKEFVSGNYDIFNGPVVALYRPEDQVFLRAYYFPNGLIEMLRYNQDKITWHKYAPIRKYFWKGLASKHTNAFTPRAAEVAAPEFYFYALKEFIYGEKPKDGIIPIVYFAPPHERPAEYYKKQGFNKIAQIGIISPVYAKDRRVYGSSRFSGKNVSTDGQSTYLGSKTKSPVYFNYLPHFRPKNITRN